MTPAIKLLENAQYHFTLHHYEHDPRTKSYGLEAVQALNLPPEQVFKTLVVNAGGELFVAIVPVNSTLNMKRMATAIKRKKVAMADQNKVQSVTGYLIGGVSPLGQKKTLPTVLDESALQFESMFVSAGKRGLDLEINPHDLAHLTSASVCHIKSTD